MTLLHITHLPAVGHLLEAIGILVIVAAAYVVVRYWKRRWKY